MQLPAGENLLRNTEMFAIVIGDVLMASGNSNSTTIKRQNIGMIMATCMYIILYVLHTCIYNDIRMKPLYSSP